MATSIPDLPTPHLLIVLPEPVVDRPLPWGPSAPPVVIVERSAPSACLLCCGRQQVDIRPTGGHGTPLTIPCPHCQQHVPLVLRHLPTGDPDARHDRPGGQHPR